MTELIYSCTDTLDQPNTSVCATDYGERITDIVLSKTEVTATGNVPTAAEFGAAFNAGIAMFLRITNGKRIFLNETEVDIITKEWHDKKHRVEGKIRLLTEAISRATERIDRYDQLYMYYFTDKDYCFGSYLVSPDFSLRVFEGDKPIYIDFKLDFYSGIDYSNWDSSYPVFISGYRALTTPDDRRLMTPDGRIIIL